VPGACLPDLVIALDASGSVQQSNFDITMEFLHAIVAGLPVAPDGVHVAGMMFHSKPLPQFLFDQGTTEADVNAALDAFVYPTDKLHGTAIGLALDHITNTILQQSSGARPDSPTMVFILTDGKSQEPDAVVAAAAQRLRDTGAIIIALGITPAVDVQQLITIAGNPGQVILRDDFSQLVRTVGCDVSVLCWHVLLLVMAHDQPLFGSYAAISLFLCVILNENGRCIKVEIIKRLASFVGAKPWRPIPMIVVAKPPVRFVSCD